MRNLPVISAFERIKITLRGVLKHIRPFSRIKYLLPFNTQLPLLSPPRKRPRHVGPGPGALWARGDGRQRTRGFECSRGLLSAPRSLPSSGHGHWGDTVAEGRTWQPRGSTARLWAGDSPSPPDPVPACSARCHVPPAQQLQGSRAARDACGSRRVSPWEGPGALAGPCRGPRGRRTL